MKARTATALRGSVNRGREQHGGDDEIAASDTAVVVTGGLKRLARAKAPVGC